MEHQSHIMSSIATLPGRKETPADVHAVTTQSEKELSENRRSPTLRRKRGSKSGGAKKPKLGKYQVKNEAINP